MTVVFSAFQGVTDALIQSANEAASADIQYETTIDTLEQRHLETIQELDLSQNAVRDEVLENFNVLSNLLKGVYLVREASVRTMDYILSFGERNSAPIIAAYLQSLDLPAQYLDARNIVKTNKEFGKAKVNFAKTEKLIRSHYQEHADTLQIVTGFIAADVGGLTTTLGRGGSDYTAAIIANILDAEVLEIWTDVDGVLTSNPRIVKNAYTIEALSYDEAMELSHFGAKVIYPPTIQPALNKSIPIYIKNTFNPDFVGTLISNKAPTEGKRKITGVTAVSNIVLLTLEGSGMMGSPGFAARMFSTLANHKINIVMITQASSEHSICIAVDGHHSKKAIKALNEAFVKEIEGQLIKPIKCEDDLSLVAVVGEKMKSVPGVSGSLFKALGNNGINVVAIAQGSSELNISIAIKRKDEHKALNLIHDAFFLSDNKKLNVFLVGVGLIGGTLLNQIAEQKERLINEKHIDIRVIALANSTKMFFEEEGVDLTGWKSHLFDHGDNMDFTNFVDRMVDYNLANSIFIDCTANHHITDFYPRILENNISIATANKVAASAPYQEYKSLHNLALHHNVQFLYETNVGAGLPVLSTLDGLVRSGDRVERIDAVISGSLSFIFNNYSPEKSFKELILAAREKGYTEPDPRDDLSGQDIKRKIIILSRVAGYPIEPEEVTIEALLPQSCMEAESIDDFLEELDHHDDYFKSLIDTAHTQNAKLRYVASLVDGKATISLEMVTSDSPFYHLDSTDNMVVFYTERYKERPLVVQGPGAGAHVTAAGVFAEIIQLGNYVV